MRPLGASMVPVAKRFGRCQSAQLLCSWLLTQCIQVHLSLLLIWKDAHIAKVGKSLHDKQSKQ